VAMNWNELNITTFW